MAVHDHPRTLDDRVSVRPQFSLARAGGRDRGRARQAPGRHRAPPKLEDVGVLRVVVRNGFSHDLGHMLLDDLAWAVKRLGAGPASFSADQRSAFHH